MTAEQKELGDAVVTAVLRLGTATVSQVLACVGDKISAARAMSEAGRVAACDRRRGRDPLRGMNLEEKIAAGKRRLVTQRLRRAARGGKIRRVGRGAYAAPLPKLFQTA